MTKGLGEALIGLKRDPDVGAVVMLAAGGIYTELYRDRSIRLAPVDLNVAKSMISEVKGLAALSGFRGRQKGDLDALAKAIVAISNLATSDDPLVLEAEVNPIIVRALGEGVIAVDALVAVAESASGP